MPDFKELRRFVAIESVIGERVALRRQGRTLIGRCPFHDDRGRPNLTVYPDTQTYYCFVCGARGDVVDFVARLEGLSQGEAARRLRGETRGSKARRPPEQPAKARDSGHLDLVYRVMLGLLALSEEHRADLVRRGLTDTDIHVNAYRTLEEGPVRTALVEGLAARLGIDALSGVPGFGRERGKWVVPGPAGLLIPVQDVEGRIVGIQVRTQLADGKYRWLSTPRLPGGASSGAPVHVAGRAKGLRGTVWVTEGPLKADVVAARMKVCAIAVPGVTSWRRVLDPIRALRPQRVIIAFDQDASPETAAIVGRHTFEAARAIRREGTRIQVASWSEGKGIDDAIVADVRIRIEVLGR